MIVWSIAGGAPEVPRCARLGLEALNDGDVTGAQEWFADGMGSADPGEVLACVVGLAGVAAARGDVSAAEKLLERAPRVGADVCDRESGSTQVGVRCRGGGTYPLPGSCSQSSARGSAAGK